MRCWRNLLSSSVVTTAKWAPTEVHESLAPYHVDLSDSRAFKNRHLPPTSSHPATQAPVKDEYNEEQPQYQQDEIYN